MPALILGPMVRWASESEATVWVETDAPCEVRVTPDGAAAASERTFAVEGHHYAIVRVRGLPEGAATPYAVTLDGAPAWPPPDSAFPPSALRTNPRSGPLRIVFGSCRLASGRGGDALRALALRMAREGPARAPHAILLLGDQVYADEVSPATLAFIRARRDTAEPPGETIADFEEYTRLYRESWSDPAIRWLLSTVPSAMIFDDHDVIDDWNTSAAWVERMRATGWWDRRIVGGFMAYVLYQHWGNLHPDVLEREEIFRRVRAAGDGGAALREYAFRCDREVEGARWSYCRDIAGTRVVMIDSRAGRVLQPGGRRMVDEHEWEWIGEHARGGFDHLLIGTSLPLIMAPALHHLEAWSEAVCDGAWGRRCAAVGERVRRAADLEHWPSFQRSFAAMCDLLRDIGAGRRGPAPASIVVLSGDVHHAYLAQLGFPRGSGVASRVWQATCSPLRNPLSGGQRRAVRFGFSRAALALTRTLSRAAGVPPPPVRWRFSRGDPHFGNQVMTLELDGRAGRLLLERPLPADGEPALALSEAHALA